MAIKSIYKKEFGLFENDVIELVGVDFSNGLKTEVLTYGGIIKSLFVPSNDGKRKNVVLSLPNLEAYKKDDFFIGCLIGRFANRIKNGKFEIDGHEYQLNQNHGFHHLHGGYKGFGKVLWDIKSIEERDDEVEINLQYLSKYGEEGYPGNMEIFVSYIMKKDKIKIIYKAKTDHKTYFNPTQHSYFNLESNSNLPIDKHMLRIDSSQILEVDDQLIPTGSMKSIKGTAFDFSKKRAIGSLPYDTCYKLDGKAELSSDKTGIKMFVETTAPGIQLYTADYLSKGLLPRSAVCLETQFFPDSPNQSLFPSTLLNPKDEYRSETVYQFIRGV
ncbi:MAG: aldose epimerase family protein [Bacteroidota bacterium]